MLMALGVSLLVYGPVRNSLEHLVVIPTTNTTTITTTTCTNTTTGTTRTSSTTFTFTSTDTTTTTPIPCPDGTPEMLDVPDVVIPFFERDVCKAKYLAKSLAVHDPDQRLGTVFLLWVSEKSHEGYVDDLTEVNRSLSGNHKVRFIDFSSEINGQKVSGWFAQ